MILLLLAYLSLQTCPALFLFFALEHVLIILFSLGKRLQELIDDPEELVRLS